MTVDSGAPADRCSGSMLSDGMLRGWLSESSNVELSSLLVVVVDEGRALAASIKVLPICRRIM